MVPTPAVQLMSELTCVTGTFSRTLSLVDVAGIWEVSGTERLPVVVPLAPLL